MAHDYHPDLAGYDEVDVLHDGCETCEARSKQGVLGLLQLDEDNLMLIWDRARARKAGERNVPGSGCDLRLMNAAEEVSTLIERLKGQERI